MSKEICISSTPHETRLAILEDDQLTEIYYERENEYTLAGSIYKGRVTRVLPGMQSAFVDIGLERDAFLYVTDFLEEQEDSADFERVGPAPGRREAAPRAAQQPRQPQEEPAVAQAPAVEGEGEEESPTGTRRWRGRRRGRGRGGRGEREPRATEPQAQAAEEPAAIESIEAVEESIAYEPVPTPERGAPGGITSAHPSVAVAGPIVLPGESLSKYGMKTAAAESGSTPAAAAAAPAGVNYVAPKPSTLVEAAVLAWDGGAQLPGETLSRYRNKEQKPVQETASQQAVEPKTEEHGEAEGVAEVITEPMPLLHEEAASAPVVEEEQAEQPEVEAAHEQEQPAVPVEQQASPVEQHAAEAHELETQEVEEEEVEFEPENASASHRVDPIAPREFRVPAPEEQAAEVEAPASQAPEVEAARTEIPEPEAAVVEAPQVEAAEKESLPMEAAEAVAEPTAEPVAELAAAPVREDSFAVEYEEEEPVEQEIAGDHVDLTEQDEAHAGEVVSQLHGFAPGAGLLEEEVIDEDEYDFELLHMNADEHDLEDIEEETLDQQNGGTELGEMVRESHLNQRLSYGPEGALAEEHEAEAEGFAAEPFLEEADEDLEEEPAADAGQPERAPRREDSRRGGRRQQGRRRPGQGGGRRPTAQMSDLPVISELLKQGQEILVQIAKEPIAKKGARITSHIALPGRYLVFMPTVNHVGVSRKIASDEERQRLKRILISEKGEASGGFIVRTAAGNASEEDLRADLRFLISLWNDIKQRSDAGKAPALIYHDLNLVERILRDQVSDNFSTIWVDNEDNYERIVRFLNRFQPSLVRRVKLYTKETPLFEQFGIQDEITKALKSKVWLKSGGSIVINQTEALVAIDINTGKYVGKTARLEDTILKTNLDAIPEIVRQIRLRDLGGIIVIDFIDMDERKNRHKVMQALEDELKADRAPSKVLQFNDFGLVAITRKRVKQSLERTLSVPCEICTGTGMVKSPTTVCNEIYIEMRKMQKHFEKNDVLLRVNPEVVKTLKAGNGRWLNELEEMTGKTIIVKSDPALHPEQFDIH